MLMIHDLSAIYLSWLLITYVPLCLSTLCVLTAVGDSDATILCEYEHALALSAQEILQHDIPCKEREKVLDRDMI